MPLVEEGWFSPDDEVVKGTVSRYLEPIKAAGVDTLILGCTHYPVLEDAVRRFMGESVTLINPGVAVAQAVKKYLEKMQTRQTKVKISERTAFLLPISRDRSKKPLRCFWARKLTTERLNRWI